MDKQNMNNKDLGAFASVDPDYIQHGLTKREYFAAIALQGMLAGRTEHEDHRTTSDIGKYAVELADLTLEALANES